MGKKGQVWIPSEGRVGELQKEFLKDLELFAGRGMQRPAEAFREWARMAALPILSATAKFSGDAERHKRYEAEYARVAKQRKTYCEKAVEVGGKMFGIVAEALETERRDFLGRLMEAALSATNSKHGQVFTPPHLAHFMAKAALGDKPQLNEDGMITVYEPACGTGIISIETMEVLRERGIAQGDVWLVAEDIDEVAYCCAYIQLSLLGVAAMVRLGDTLAMKWREVAYTPAAFLHGTIWRWRRSQERARQRDGATSRRNDETTMGGTDGTDGTTGTAEAAAVPVPPGKAVQMGQLVLF